MQEVRFSPSLLALGDLYPLTRTKYMLKEKDYSDAITAVMIFGLIETISCFIFIYNIWKSMGNTGPSK